MDERCSCCSIRVGPGHIYTVATLDGVLLCSACHRDILRWGYLYLGEGRALVISGGGLKKARTSEKRLLELAQMGLPPEKAAAMLLKVRP